MIQRSRALFLAALAIALVSSLPSRAHAEKTFKTRYTTVHYNDDKDLSDFIWRLGGKRFDITLERELASNRIDRIIDRVQTILDMRPPSFQIDIYLKHGVLKYEKVALFEYKTKSIQVAVEYASDGVFAHEVAHAVINQYFVTPPPSKIQEILAQYVDRHLWSDY